VSYVARIPLLGIEKKTCLLHEITRDDPLPLLTLAELAARKFTALISRGAARDFFDALSFINYQPTILEEHGFRVALLCQAAGSRTDLRHVDAIRTLSRHEVVSQLLPLLRVRSSTAPFRTAELLEKLNDGVRPTVQEIVKWSDAERHFLERFLGSGELEPQHLTEDGELHIKDFKTTHVALETDARQETPGTRFLAFIERKIPELPDRIRFQIVGIDNKAEGSQSRICI
jgi:hypothetical protein